MKKRILAILLAVCIVLSTVPAALATSTTECTESCTHAAVIGSTYYDTLQEACDAAKDGETVTLLSEINFTKETAFENNGWYDGVKYTGDQSFTIDLNGKTISDNGELNDYLLYFMNKGSKANEITLKNGTISGGANLWAVLTVGSQSALHPTTLNLGDDLIVIGDGSGINGETAVAKSRYGSIINVLDGATVKTDKADYCVAAGEIASDTTAIVNVYSGATITNNAGGIAVSGTANVNISGGTITSTGWGVYTMTSGTPVFTISGGSITGTSGAVASAADVSNYPDAAPSVTVSGGNINGTVASINYGSPAENAGAELAVTGGTFDTDVSDYCAGGFECESNGSGAYVVGEMQVAEIDGTIFSTLQAAFDAAQDGDTIKILCDITITEATAQVTGPYVDGVMYTGDKSFTVDFGGHTVTDDGCVNDYLIWLNNKGTKANEITFTNGKIVSKNGCWATVCVNGTSSTVKSVLNLNGMTITNSNGTNYGGNEAVRACERATVNVNSGTTLTSKNASYAIAAYTQNSTININSGATVIQQDSSGSAVNHTCAAVSGLGTINIYDGATISSDRYGVLPMTSANPIVNIYGGTITATNTALYAATNGDSYQSTTINVYGGTITGALYEANDKSQIYVSGGTFSVDPNAYCLDGYKAVSSAESGLYTVQADPAAMVAQLSNGVKYTSLQAAIDAAAVGSTVTLLKDVTLTETVTIAKTLALDLNGCTITNATTAPITVDGATKLTTVTVKDSSEDETGAIVAANTDGENDDKAAILIAATYRGTFILESGTLQATKYGIRAKMSNTSIAQIVINGGTIKAPTNGYGVYANYGSVTMNGGQITGGTWGIAAYEKFTMNGGTIEAELGYCSNGSYDNTVAVIKGGTIKGSVYSGIYWPSAGSLTIEGGSVSGYSGVILKSGSLSITGGTLHGSGEKTDYEYVEGGGTETGDALVIDNVGGDTGYEAISSVSITGGTFTSANASAVASYTAGNEGVEAVTGFISGGTYSDNSAEAYLADGYSLESYVNGEGKTVYGVEPVYTVTITIPDGATIVVQDSNGTEVSAEDNGTYELANGTYTYTVSKDGYHTETASFTVNGADVNFSVELAAINYYTVVYTDGVNGVEIFADYVFEDIEEGSATPIVSNPTRFGYIFTGWNPEVSDTVTGDVTYTATWSYNPPYIPVVPTSYSITVEDATNGDVSADRRSATSGQTVTISVEPDTGYVLETLVVLDRSGNEITLTRVSENTYSFQMPASKVTVYATFMEDNTMLNYFVDVFAGDYYYDAVLWAVENNITNGTSDIEFSPNLTCTRAQAVTFLWRAAGSPEPASSVMPFEDVAAETYYYKAVQWAVENGVTNGTSATTFSPDADCTRAQIVTFLWRSQQSPANNAANPFADVAADAYYAEAVLWAVENEITNGTSATAFSPDADCTRAQIVTFLYRCMGDK